MAPHLTQKLITFGTRSSHQQLQEVVDQQLVKGAVQPVHQQRSQGFFSRLFLILKKTGDLCPMMDLLKLNCHLVVPHFSMETNAPV